jgi:hypothetical protein
MWFSLLLVVIMMALYRYAFAAYSCVRLELRECLRACLLAYLLAWLCRRRSQSLKQVQHQHQRTNRIIYHGMLDGESRTNASSFLVEGLQ